MRMRCVRLPDEAVRIEAETRARAASDGVSGASKNSSLARKSESGISASDCSSSAASKPVSLSDSVSASASDSGSISGSSRSLEVSTSVVSSSSNREAQEVEFLVIGGGRLNIVLSDESITINGHRFSLLPNMMESLMQIQQVLLPEEQGAFAWLKNLILPQAHAYALPGAVAVVVVYIGSVITCKRTNLYNHPNLHFRRSFGRSSDGSYNTYLEQTCNNPLVSLDVTKEVILDLF